MAFSSRRFTGKTDQQLLLMRKAGLIVAAALRAAVSGVREGATTADLDTAATETILSLGGKPNFPMVPGYRHTLCVSVNDEVVHGIPGERVLALGDVVSIDCGAVINGWHGDAAVTVIVGGEQHARPEDLVLVEATRQSLWSGIGAFVTGARLHNIGAAVEDTVREHQRASGLTFGILEDYEGHGIGRQMHMQPGVPNFATQQSGPKIPAGATVAIEPMVTLGTIETHVLADEWTVCTDDGSRAAHWEHSVATRPQGLWVLTAEDGGEAELTARGLPFAPLAD